MKILYLCSDLGVPVLGRKGASVHVRSMVEALVELGHNVNVVAAKLTKDPWEDPAACAAPVIHMGPSDDVVSPVVALDAYERDLCGETAVTGQLRRVLYDAELGRRLVRRWRNHTPDLVYERACLFGTAGAALARTIDVPLILEVNSPLASEQQLYRSSGMAELAQAAERKTLTGADRVVVVSEALGEHVVKLGVEPERVEVVPNAVDSRIFYPGEPDPDEVMRWGLGDGVVLGFVGNLRPWHGVDALPELLDRLSARHSNLRLVVVGDGPARAQLESDFAARGLSDKVVITGTLPHESVAGIVRGMDIALAPYPELGHDFYFSPLKMFEYMAAGCALVASAQGQIAEIVEDGRTGLLYRPGDIDALEAACDSLISGEDLRTDIGAAAARLIAERHTWTGNAQRVIEIAGEISVASS